MDLLTAQGQESISTPSQFCIAAGGKTASLKTLGLTALMAKAGLFIPLASNPDLQSETQSEDAAQIQSSNPIQNGDVRPAVVPGSSISQHTNGKEMSNKSQGSDQASSKSDASSSDLADNSQVQHSQQHNEAETPQEESGIQQQHRQPQQLSLSNLSHGANGVLQNQQEHQQPKLVFFEQVLADVGDAQDLQQSLSTFSGHISRLQGILQDVTPQSMVLLDEVRATCCCLHL